MPPFAFTIREIEGSQRSVELRSRALPYWPQEWPGEQHHVQRWYPGNRVATIQVLGPREGDLEVNGKWKSRFVASDVRLIGFDDIEAGAFARADEFPNLIPPIWTAEDLVEAMRRIRIAGNTVQVNWGPEVLRGIMSRFVPNYDRIEDIEWTATFVWSQRGEQPAPRASVGTDRRVELLDAMNDLDNTLAQEPSGVLETQSESITDSVNTLRGAVVSYTQALSELQTTATVTTQQFQALQAIGSRVAQAANVVRGRSNNLPYVDLLPLDTVNLVTDTEVWRRTLGRDAERVQASSARTTEAIGEQAVPDVQQIVTIAENETLRDVAQRFYGDADSWTVIADANGLVGSVVPRGQQVIVPQAPQPGNGATVSL